MTRRSPVARVLLSSSTALTALAVAAAITVCILLGLWQLSRHQDRVEMRDTIAANYTANPVPIQDIIPSPDAPLPTAQEWRTTTLEGSYCSSPECVLYVRNRPLNGDVGFWQLVPFTTADRTVLVVRGWVPIQPAASQPALTPEVPAGTQSLVVRLRPTEQMVRGRENPEGQLQTVTAAEAAQVLPGNLPPLQTAAYGELATEPLAPAEMPRALEKPDTGLGPHLSYAVQWWIFALFFLAGGIARTRGAIRDAREEDAANEGQVSEAQAGAGQLGGDEPGAARPGAAASAEETGTRAAPKAKPRRRRPRRLSDEEEEDALLDP